MREKDLGVDITLHDRVEAVCWKHRIPAEVPDHMDNIEEGFGYLVQEYWRPNPVERTVDLDVCPWWVNTEEALAEMPVVWEWADKQLRLIKAIVGAACRELENQDLLPVRVEAPYGWNVFELSRILGLRTSYVDTIPAVYSASQFGRFVPLRPMDGAAVE